MDHTFETALASRVDEMLDACTRCGKCFEACPITGAAGIADADPQATIAGVLDIVRTGDGPEASRKWASSCVLSGECIKVCDYGVNPRFLLNMARVAIARTKNEPRERRKLGVQQAVEKLCAIQAQWPQSPYIALWTRLIGFRKEQLTRALEQHKVVKSTLFRITLHITSAGDYPYYAAAVLPAARETTPREFRSRARVMSRS